MTLQVPYEQFVDAVQRVLAIKEAYVTCHGSVSLVTASSATVKTVVVAALSPGKPEQTKKELAAKGMEVYDGAWSAEGLTDLGETPPPDPHVAAVAYMSDDGKPGIWIDAYDSSPSPAQVLRGMYDEFRGTGEIADVSFEEFVRLANANVILVSPSQLKAYIQEKAVKVTGI